MKNGAEGPRSCLSKDSAKAFRELGCGRACARRGLAVCFESLWVFLESVGRSSVAQGGGYATNDTLSLKRQDAHSAC